MNWKTWLGSNLYKKLWSLIGGRQWTFIYRDIWHKLEWFPQMQWAFTGIGFEYLRNYLGWPFWTHSIWIAIYTYGYINGHFFWGREYQEGQKGE